MNLLKKQRDAVGLSVYSSAYDFYISEKGSERHFNLITNKLEQLLASQPKSVGTNTVKYLHEISEKLYKRSLIFFFTDMFQYAANKKELFDALRHLKYKKHEVVLLHTLDYKTEVNLDYNNTPKKFSDLETGEEINLYPENIKELYTKKVTAYINEIKLVCAKYKIKYVPVDVSEGFEKIINTYLVEKQKLG
jgi:hypothetical protein